MIVSNIEWFHIYTHTKVLTIFTILITLVIITDIIIMINQWYIAVSKNTICDDIWWFITMYANLWWYTTMYNIQ